MTDIKKKNFKISDNIVISKMDDSAVLLNLQSGAYFELNEVGLCIAENLKNLTTLIKIKSIIIKNFDVKDQECEDDILLFLKQLLERDILEFKD
tara:strand:- start:1653 stop:1934 length:282 start_codon:yes stop_codon:yes gene_type:complete